MTSTLQPIRSDVGASFAYYGDRAGWLIGLTVHRDSDAIDRSNWRVIVPAMMAEHPGDAAVERMHHWAVGWIDYLLVRPDSAAVKAAEQWAARLDNYPAADDSDWTELEWDEEWCIRCDRGTRADHPLAGCKFRSEDDASEIEYLWRHRREMAR